MATKLDVSEILDRIAKDQDVTKAQLETAATAAARLRAEFLQDAFRAIGTLTPHTTDFEAFKNCLKSVIDLLLKTGFMSVSEAQLIWLRIEEVER